MGYRHFFKMERQMMQWKIKQLFLDFKDIESCEFDNGEMLSPVLLNLAKSPKLKNPIGSRNIKRRKQ